jgi:hypothetical protein
MLQISFIKLRKPLHLSNVTADYSPFTFYILDVLVNLAFKVYIGDFM